jgi:hypothetical protein
MDVNLEGVYPTLRLENSRMLMDDGTVMRFADTSIEARDLFQESTYQTLIADAQQDSVVWGDWEISRTPNDGEQSDFLMERAFGDNARVHFKRSNAEQEVPAATGQRREENQMEVGFEYRLKSKDSVKFSLREGEEFVGVERKLKF